MGFEEEKMGLVKEDDAMDGCLLALFFSVIFALFSLFQFDDKKAFRGSWFYIQFLQSRDALMLYI